MADQPSGSFRSIATLLFCAGLLFAGYGLFVTLLPLRADLEGFSTSTIGLLGTVYSAGFMVGCLAGPRLIQAVGHIRCFAGCAAMLCFLSLTFPMLVDPYSWGVLRVLAGICLAILFVVVESWLNDQSSNEIRGRVLSAYIIVINIVTMAGQGLVNVGDIGTPVLFMATAMLVCAAIVPLALTPTAAPKPIPAARFNPRGMFAISPVGVVGCLLVGCVEGAFWTLGPVFGQERGMPVGEVTLFMIAFVFGGALSQWPLGRASDKTDRRVVIAAAALGTVVTGMALALWEPPGPWMGFALAVAHGALMTPLYPLCLAHANDKAPNERMVEVSSGLILIYSVGATIGPLAAAALMEDGRPGGLFAFIAAALGALALYAVYRLVSGTWGDAVERVEFVPVPKTSQSVYTLEADD